MKKHNPHIFLNLMAAGEENEEYFPILTDESEETPSNPQEVYPETLPILPVRNTVLFPGVVLPITVTREKSVKLVKKSYKGEKIIGVVAQSNHPSGDEIGLKDVYKIGTAARILKMFTLPDGNVTILIQGRKKFIIETPIEDEEFLLAKVSYPADIQPDLKKRELKALEQSLKETALRIVNLNPDIPQDAQVAVENIQSFGFLVHFLSANVNAEVFEKQEILELAELKERANKLLELMWRDVQLLELKQEINSKAHSDIDQQQRDYFLRQQMKVLQDELGDGAEKEVDDLRLKAKGKKWSDEVAKHFKKELEKVSRMSSSSPDYAISLNYVEFMVDLPWYEYTQDHFDLKKAKEILDKDHFGLDKAKERIIEYLAVLKLKNNLKGPILCFYGPPGVGKTSLGKSIAKALKRKYARMSLGGLHDEAEIRGHRKTYIGAMAGKILQNVKKSESSNPVFILDEIDKVGSDFRGDPASALLEVLDPEQNNAFTDNYLEVPYDLSQVLFIATANSLDSIHPALRDRMEILEINGYTLEEKIQIAKKHLIPKLRKDHGLKATDFSIDEKAISKVIDSYTRESGVRNLEQKLAAVVRNIAKKVAMEEIYNKKLQVADIERILGMSIFDKELYEDNEDAGVVTGLAWTPVGGEILFIESSLNRGKGNVIISGQLGDVMKESATAALSFLKANADMLEIDYRLFNKYDLHIHVPAGAVPKDGPSAGITMLTSLASLFTQRKVRHKLAMTGEITLRGKVLPVGGIKEKILAAKRAGITDIVMSVRNKKDISEIKAEYITGLTIHYANTVHDVLDLALLKEKVKRPIQFRLDD